MSDKANVRRARKQSKAQALLTCWELNSGEIMIGDAIGEGGQATVHEGKWRGLDVAIKAPQGQHQMPQGL